jgi:hypothetical protein
MSTTTARRPGTPRSVASSRNAARKKALPKKAAPKKADVKKATPKKAAAKKSKSKDRSAGYNKFKEFNGKLYTGVQIGRGHHWNYDKGDWKETKITPDLWEISYAVTKRRVGKAPETSGVPVGTEYHARASPSPKPV